MSESTLWKELPSDIPFFVGRKEEEEERRRKEVRENHGYVYQVEGNLINHPLLLIS